jgi:hypothetical protein
MASQGSHEGVAVGIKGKSVRAQSVCGRPLAGHDRGAIGHAYRIGNKCPIEAVPAVCKSVDMGSAHGYLAGVAEMIYTKLIGNDHNNIHELASLLG